MTRRAYNPGDPALDRPQYDREQVLEKLGATDGQLKGILDRKLVVLSIDHNPGTGNRRLYTGGDIVRLAAALSGSSVGIPMRYANQFSTIVYDTACARMNHGPVAGLAIASYPSDDQWRFIGFSDRAPLDKTKLPSAYCILDVDQLLNSILPKLDTSFSEEDRLKWNPPPPSARTFADPFAKGRGRSTTPMPIDREVVDAAEASKPRRHK